MSKVFISYSATDEPMASRVAKILEDLDIEYFLDRKDVHWGDKIVDRVSDGLSESSDVVIVLSPASLKSQWVAFEVGHAKALRKRLLPILTHPALDVPDFLRGINYVSSVAEVRRHFKSAKGQQQSTGSTGPSAAAVRVNVPSSSFQG